ncbi:MAG: spore coat protein [Bacilli bacterium]|jgi:hypothetical protein
MNTPPKMISTKDLDYIKDMLTCNLILSKKAHHYEDYVEDEDVKNIVEKVCKTHAKHYQKILNLLK